MIPAILFLVFGGFLTWVAVVNWRHRSEEKISALEAAILRATGEEPLPLTRLDKAFQTFHLVFASIFGPLFLLLGAAMLAVDLGRMS
ncbi:hypothetical protein [Novosphingobium sp. KA1]|uniref:hypothetical protein n=1 Tax=Novosphingobium sp. (strain KA1) TaxID=164608 RepID=UPI001A8DD539|nr:hypothetical protein [Novosphingobium sp. KA1]QSR18072.1 hypothetical protein CA833_12875 [Novosphingobium sp. KA1]